MKKRRSLASGILAGSAMLVIILDGKTALNSMQEGLQLCIQTVIPSLFPFFVLSGIINSFLLGEKTGIFQYIGRFCKIPKGGESLLAVGFLSGYPVGAQLVSQAYRNGKLPLHTAHRMLGFCSNAGPAFLFGMLSPLFSNPIVPWLLWGIHIAGALIVGWILPGGVSNECIIEKAESISISDALNNAIKNMAMVCGWVVVFRLMLGFCSRWFLWMLPIEVQVLFSGVLELSNGCILLRHLQSEGMRFVLASLMLSFGGLCVMMQTRSVTQDLGFGYYFPGKVLQALLATCISCLLQPVIFSNENMISMPTPAYILLIIVTVLGIYLVRRKKVVAFGRRLLYNTGS